MMANDWVEKAGASASSKAIVAWPPKRLGSREDLALARARGTRIRAHARDTYSEGQDNLIDPCLGILFGSIRESFEEKGCGKKQPNLSRVVTCLCFLCSPKGRSGVTGIGRTEPQRPSGLDRGLS